jgi:hypothetical protein
LKRTSAIDLKRKLPEIAKNTMTPDVSSLDYAAFPRVAAKLTAIARPAW